MIPTVTDFAVEAGQPDRSAKEKIRALEARMRECEQVEIQTKHHFANGIYAREITIPAGVVLTGKVHKTQHLNIVSKGRILIYTEDGLREVVAPCTIVSPPGTKRVGYALEETVWTTIHATTETDVDLIEAALIEPDQPQIEGKEKPLWLG